MGLPIYAIAFLLIVVTVNGLAKGAQIADPTDNQDFSGSQFLKTFLELFYFDIDGAPDWFVVPIRIFMWVTMGYLLLRVVAAFFPTGGGLN